MLCTGAASHLPEDAALPLPPEVSISNGVDISNRVVISDSDMSNGVHISTRVDIRNGVTRGTRNVENAT